MRKYSAERRVSCRLGTVQYRTENSSPRRRWGECVFSHGFEFGCVWHVSDKTSDLHILGNIHVYDTRNSFSCITHLVLACDWMHDCMYV